MTSIEFLLKTKKVASYKPSAIPPPLESENEDGPPWEGGRYKKRPVEIEAYQWFKNGDHPDDGIEDTEGEIVRYYCDPGVDGSRMCAHCYQIMHDHGWIDTLEGGHIVCPGDWIITGVENERYPIKDGIFHKTYEPV